MRIKLSTMLATTLIFTVFFFPTKVSGTKSMLKSQLKFNSDGTFKIVQFTDIHGGPTLDEKTSHLMKKVLELEKPDLVVLTGDMIDGKCKTKGDIKNTIESIASLIEKDDHPWGVILGNHDDEHGLVTKKEIMEMYMSFPKNISSIGPDNINGVGNYSLLVNNSKDSKPIFNLYMMDSGNYAPSEIGGYAWIKHSQIDWYRSLSSKLNKKNKGPLPALMFLHIAIPEFKQSWSSGKATGTRNEEECSPKINSGLFYSLLEMGDVKGVFVGHDHTNDYVADYYGIKLGYCRGTGHGTYGKEDFPRGARVFLIKEEDPSKFETWLRTENEF